MSEVLSAQIAQIAQIAGAYFPELIITLFIIFNLIAGQFFSTYLYKLSKWFTILGIVLALCSTFYLQIEPEAYAFNDTFLTNIYTVFFKILILISGFCLTLLSRNMIREKRDRAFEYFAVFLSGILFAMCVVSSVDFISLFVSLEALGLSCYLLLSLNKNPDAKQLTFGYIIQNAVVSSLFLMGLSLIYGMCAQTNFDLISLYFSQNQPQILLTFAMILMLCTFLFKLGLVPFSSWLPDTFEGASHPIGAYMSLIPVLACFGILSRILLIFLNYTFTIKIVLASIAVLTILFGSLSAIRQENLKRLMAYSMSVQSGIMLLGLCVFSVYSLSSVLFYLFCYVISTIGAWSAIILLYNSAKLEKLDDLKGVIYHRPYYVIAFTTILIALAGLAPTCGFAAKLYIFSAVARSGFIFLPFLIAALVCCVIMIYGYWRIIRALFRRIETQIEIDTRVISSKFILYACALATVFACLFADKIIQLCQLAAYYM